jgi:hypothetical protein
MHIPEIPKNPQSLKPCNRYRLVYTQMLNGFPLGHDHKAVAFTRRLRWSPKASSGRSHKSDF